MLPNSSNQNGKYEFIRGDYKSIIKRNVSEILNDLGITLNLNTKFETHIEKNERSDDIDVDDLNYLPEKQEMMLINGLNFECDIHHFARKIDSGELSLFTLFCTINCLSPKNCEIAYEKVLMNPHLTPKAQLNFDSIKINCLNNSSYYQQYLIKK